MIDIPQWIFLRNIDDSGILHVLHPASPEAEQARKIVDKISQLKWS